MRELDCAFDFNADVGIASQDGEPETGLTDVELRLSATRGGAAIDASLSGTATESETEEGRYVVTFALADMQAYLASDYLRQVVYLVVDKPGAIETKSYAYRVVQSS
jgi:hypothetical protein